MVELVENFLHTGTILPMLRDSQQSREGFAIFIFQCFDNRKYSEKIRIVFGEVLYRSTLPETLGVAVPYHRILSNIPTGVILDYQFLQPKL